MDSVMKGLRGIAPPPRIIGLEPPLVHLLLTGITNRSSSCGCIFSSHGKPLFKEKSIIIITKSFYTLRSFFAQITQCTSLLTCVCI